MSKSTDIAHGNENKLQQAVANVGPISVCIDANHDGFMDYESGEYESYLCLIF